MTMKITVEENIPALKGFLHHHFGCIILRAHLGAWSNPLSVKILSQQRASVVANNYTIRVKHRHYLKDEIVPQEFGSFLIRDQILKYSVHDK